MKNKKISCIFCGNEFKYKIKYFAIPTACSNCINNKKLVGKYKNKEKIKE